MGTHPYRHILIVRTDRIGDVILALPMITVLKSNVPSARISMLVREYTKELADGYPGLTATLVYDEQGRPKPFLRMLKEIRSQRFDLAVVSHPTPRIAWLLFLARIGKRVGTGYRWYSFLFNHRVYEHRKTAEKHELEYNLSLLSSLALNHERVPRFALSIPPSAVVKAKDTLGELGILETDELVVLHPGGGGSARDWSPQNFGKLAAALVREGVKVVVTGGPGEEKLVRTVVETAGGRVQALVGRLSLIELAAFLKQAKILVANSTGPLHIAAAVGTPVIGLYPPIKACSPERWGPYTGRKTVFVPDAADCPRCAGKPCEGNECMDLITVDHVLQAALSMRALAGSPQAASTR